MCAGVAACLLVGFVLASPVGASYTSTLNGGTASLTGDSASDQLSLGSYGGFLQQNRAAAGDPGFFNNTDFDTNSAGAQTVVIGPSVTLIVDAGPGSDTVEISLFDASYVDYAISSLVAGPGSDIVSGGGWADIINVQDGERDLVTCGPGSDAVTADSNDVIWTDCEQVSAPASSTATPEVTGQRAAALKKCKKKRTAKARKKCRKRAKALPI
jgi:hypothetical protein